MALAETQSSSSPSPVFAALARVSTGAWITLAVVFVALRDLLGRVRSLADQLGDTDDATRLVQVREWLAGRDWFDLSTLRFGLDDGLVSHWSRLIDLPIGALITGFGLFLPTAEAEVAARAVWPILLLAPLFIMLARAAEREGGPVAAAAAVFLTAGCLSGLIQFAAGRIDHHNVMILAAVAAGLLAPRAFDRPRLAWLGGTLAGLGLAIGYEGIILTVAILGLVTFAGLAERGAMATAARFATATFLALALVFVATVHPSRYGIVVCDALSLNMVAGAGIGAAGLWLAASRLVPDHAAARFAVLAMAGLVGLAGYLAVQPACMSGPFAGVDPGVKAFWLDHVTETRSILWFAADAPVEGMAVFVYLAIATIAAGQIAAEDRNRASLIQFALMVVASVLACWQLKLVPYATFLAIVPLAVFTTRLGAVGSLPARTARILFVVVATQSTIVGMGKTATLPFSGRSEPQATYATATLDTCTSADNLRPLARLAPGRISAPIDMGPSIVAHTPHNALAAPYHRLTAALLAHRDIWTGTDMSAIEARLHAASVQYVVTCGGVEARYPDAVAGQPRLGERLREGAIPNFLVPLPEASGGPVKVYRFVPRPPLRG